MTASSPESAPTEAIPAIGWPVKIALAWSSLVVLGCLGALLCIDFGVESTAEFVVLVRNIALMGAAAIALPVSLYLLGLRERTFRMDLTKVVRDEVERQKREVAEEIKQRENEMREAEARIEREKEQEENYSVMKIVEFVSDQDSCLLEDIQKAFSHQNPQDIEDTVLAALNSGLISAKVRDIEAFEGTTRQFGRISITPEGRAGLRRIDP